MLTFILYKYHELCPGNKFKALFDTMTNNKPFVRLGDGFESAALIHYYSNSSTIKKIGSCEFTVKLDNPDSSSGIFASIKKLKLRENTYDGSCKDFIRFTYKNGTRTREICGNIETSPQNNLIRNFFDETSGEMKVEISIDTLYSSSVDGLEVFLVFTAYSDCFGSSLLRCSPEKCISDLFRDDKILNCPPPGCLDESNCVNHEKPIIISVRGESSNSSGSGSAHIIVPVVIVIAVLTGILCFCKKKKTTTNSHPPNSEHVEELRPTARSDLDSYLEFQDVRNIPTVPNQHNYRSVPYAAQEEHIGPMPLVPPDQRHDRPMPTAPPCGFKDDPPPYDTLFNASHNKPANV
ncbi:hypothetical protein HA402_015989 [Bradysia odoriphaga]|nr:hypothetical protein HA402_015989 [Bradysia odoriphaga]